jgi:hypothetical protein
VFTSCLVTAFNNVLYFRAHVLTGWRLSPQLSTFNSTRLHCTLLHLLNWVGRVIESLNAPHRKRRFQELFYCCVTQVSHVPRFAVSPLVRVMNLLPSSGRCLQSHYLATGLHATICYDCFLAHPFHSSFTVILIFYFT